MATAVAAVPVLDTFALDAILLTHATRFSMPVKPRTDQISTPTSMIIRTA